jgi:hypothetical protein
VEFEKKGIIAPPRHEDTRKSFVETKGNGKPRYKD